MNTIETIDIGDVSLLAGTQVRTSTDEVAVIKYHEAMEDAGTNTMFPPIIVYRDKAGVMWIADGHHRVQASIRSHLTTIVAEVREGTKADAIRVAVLANRHNGVPLSKADRFKAMEMLLEISPELTDGALAELLGMPRKTVHDWRQQFQRGDFATLTPRVGKDGKTRNAKQNKKPKATPSLDEAEVRVGKPPRPPVSPPVEKPTEHTPSPQAPQQAQTSAKSVEEVLYEYHESVWTEVSEGLNQFQTRIREYRKFYGDKIYTNRIHNLFEI